MSLIRSRIWTAAMLALALSALPVRAVSEPPRPPTSALGKIRDLAATVKARRVLQENPALAELNLGVSVENGVAQVWGPVPTTELAREAVVRLEGISGVRQVRSNFYVEDRKDRRLLDLVRPEGVPERIEAAKPEIETGKLPPLRPAVTVGRTTRPAENGPTLFAPRAVPSQRSEAAAEQPRSTGSLSEQVRQLQQAEPRFRGIVVEVQNQSLHVRQGNQSGADVMELVQKLRRLPGVRDVLLSND